MLFRPLARFVLAAAAVHGMATAQPGVGGGLQVWDANAMLTEKLGATVPGDIELVDQHRRTVRIGDYFTGQRPVLLNLGYFGCPAMCGAVLNGLMTGLEDLNLRPGVDYELVSVSFDPREKPSLAAEKQKAYAEHYVKLPLLDSWHVLTGEESQVRRLAEAVGFGYSMNEHTQVYDHPAAVMFLSPDGKVSRYLYGVAFAPKDLKFAILETGEGRVGSLVDRILLSCYAYDPAQRTYGVLATRVMQVGGAMTLLILGSLVWLLFRHERRNRTAAAETVGSPSVSR